MLRKNFSHLEHNNPTLTQALQSNFYSLFNLDYEQFIKEIQKLIPESLLLKQKANASAEGISADKACKNIFGLTEDEEIRAFSGLLRFKDVINGTEKDYNNFVACQIEMKKPVLSFAEFQKMQEYVKHTLRTPEDYAAAMWSILCNDLGKVHSVIQAYESLPNKKKLGHDMLLAELLKQKPEMFPGFSALSPYLQEKIIDGYASGCDISMLEQLELPQTSVSALTKLDKKALELYILHTIFDVSGAAAHFKANGSLTMHAETWAFFNALREALEKLNHDKNNTIEDAYQAYVQYRGRCIGIDPKTPVDAALIRIAGLARLATPEQGKMLMSVWSDLPLSAREILTQELTVHGGQGLRAIFIGYGVAMLLNPQGALQKELTEASKALGITVSPEQRATANREGLKIGLMMMAKVFQKTREIIANDDKPEIFVAECDEVARFLSKEPRKALDLDLNVTSSCERRIDFNLTPKPSLQNQANDGTFVAPASIVKVSTGPSLFSNSDLVRQSVINPVIEQNKPRI